MSKISVKLIKEYIVNNDKSSVMRFKNMQERDLWLHNTQTVFNESTLDDLNNIVDEINIREDSKSTRLFLELYAKQLSNLTKDISVMTTDPIDLVNSLNLQVSQYRINDNATYIINHIIGSSICNILRTYSDESVYTIATHESLFKQIIMNYIKQVYADYYQSKGINSHGLSEYTIKRVLESEMKQNNTEPVLTENAEEINN